MRRFGKTYIIPIRHSAVTYVTSEYAVTFTVTALKPHKNAVTCTVTALKPHKNTVTFTVTTLKTSQK
jgi:hypothetical protein